jgi:hypothetical protein
MQHTCCLHCCHRLWELHSELLTELCHEHLPIAVAYTVHLLAAVAALVESDLCNGLQTNQITTAYDVLARLSALQRRCVYYTFTAVWSIYTFANLYIYVVYLCYVTASSSCEGLKGPYTVTQSISRKMPASRYYN